MSAITIENDLVHYEVLGRGRPVILLHGWLGSWRYWVPSMQQLSAKYRAYALDLWGFGDTGKEPRRFDFASQVALLDQFMEKMGISKAALVGHDLGAAVAARYATLHPDRVPRLLVVSPPLFQMAPSSVVLNIPAATSRQIAAASGTVSTSGTAAIPGGGAQPEAETMPWRTEEIRERIRQAVDVQARQLGEAALSEGEANALKPKTALEATQPPTDKPAVEVSAGTPASTGDTPADASVAVTTGTTGAVAEGAAPSTAGAAEPPAGAAEPSAGAIQSANPLKAQLGTFNRLELLEKHVEAGTDRDKLKVEVEKAHDKAIEVGIESFAGVDTLRELIALTMPVVAVSGVNDTLVLPPSESMQQSLKDSAGPFLYVPMEGTRHFPMLENITGFTRLLLDFLEVPDVTTIEIKKLWERRVR